MADQTIEIRLIMRDELTKAMDAAFANMRKHDASINTSKATEGFERLGKAIAPVRRELSALSQITIGGLLGGGLVAGIVATGKALQDMSSKSLQLHYTAQSLGVSTAMLHKYSDGLMALGRSESEGAEGIKAAVGALRDLQVEGKDSSVFKQLEKGKHGKELARELMAEINGPRGMEGALRLLLHRMEGMNPEAQRAISKMFGLGTVAARDLLDILPKLNKRYELSVKDALALELANTNLKISWDNIKTQLASAFIPIFEKLATTLDKFLQSEAGQKFLERLRAWGQEMATAFEAWVKAGGLDDATKALKGTVDTLGAAFTAADEVIKSMDLTWPMILGGLVAIKFASWLGGVATGLAGLAKYTALLTLLARMTPTALIALTALWLRGKGGADEAAERIRRRNRDQIERIPGLTPEQRRNLEGLPWLRQQPGTGLFGPDAVPPKPMGGTEEEGLPKTPAERRADLQEKKRATRQLTEEFGALEYSLAKLNDYIMPGGPEGGGGTSGFQNLSRDAYDAKFIRGPLAGKYDAVVAAAAKQDVPPALFAAIMALETKAPRGGGFGMSRATLAHLNPGGLMGGGRGNRKFMSFPTIEAGLDKMAAVVARNHHRGGYTIEGMAEHYAPVRRNAAGEFIGPVANDPHNTNRLWPGLIKRFHDDLAEKEEVSGGLQGSAVPYTALEQQLAAQRGGGSISGNASIDIDISGIGKTRDPSRLFRPTPLEGIVQMQDPPYVVNNPNSYQ